MLIPALLATAALFVLVWSMLNLFTGDKGSARTKKRLSKIKQSKSKYADIERRHSMSELSWFDRILKGLSLASNLDLLLYQAGMKMNVAVLLLISAFCAGTALWIGNLTVGTGFGSIFIALAAGCIPLMFVRFKRRRRMNKFQRQLPEALELIGRSLKAGHAFTQGMRMVAEEFSDPIGPEFEKTLDEINFGVSVQIALNNLITRVDCPDLKFFVVSVNVQRETGGNLAEIINNISKLVRERFKFHGRVKVLAAEGKLTAYILLGLPFGVGFLINFLNPDYMSALIDTDLGKNLITAGAVSMTFGALVIKKMIAIKV